MRTEVIKIYKFDELSEEAKEKAREWWRNGALDDEWWKFVYEDAENVGLKINSFDLDRHEISGEFINYPIDTAKQIFKNHGQHTETHKTAKNYYSFLYAFNDEIRENAEHEFLYDLLEDYRIILRQELDFLMSDESVDESIIINEHEFTEDGDIY